MKKIKRAAFWFISNAAFAWSLWAGYDRGIPGAHHVAVFMVWFSFIGSLMVFSEEVQKKMQANGPSVPMGMNGFFDAGVVGFLVWHGSIFLGVIYLMHTIFLQGTYAAAKETTP